MKNCNEHPELISAYADNELTKSEKRHCCEHLNACDNCSALLELYREVSVAADESCVPAPEALRSGIMEELLSERAPRAERKFKQRDTLRVVLSRYVPIAACLIIMLLAVPRLFNPGGTDTAPGSEDMSLSETVTLPTDNISHETPPLTSDNPGGNAGLPSGKNGDEAPGGNIGEIDGGNPAAQNSDGAGGSADSGGNQRGSGNNGDGDGYVAPPASGMAPDTTSAPSPDSSSAPPSSPAPSSRPKSPNSSRDTPGYISAPGETPPSVERPPAEDTQSQSAPPVVPPTVVSPPVVSPGPDGAASEPEQTDISSGDRDSILSHEPGGEVLYTAAVYAIIEISGSLDEYLAEYDTDSIDNVPMDIPTYYEIPRDIAEQVIDILKGRKGVNITIVDENGEYAIVIYKPTD